jgi:short-subunit dehydrogenase
MIKQNSGKILNVSSIAAFQPDPLMAIYFATKAFSLSYSQALANELKETNVTVTVLCSGMTKTNFQHSTGNTQPNFGKLCCSAHKVALYGFHAMQKGKKIAIPCYYNRIIANIHRFLTFNQATNLSRFLQERNRKKE